MSELRAKNKEKLYKIKDIDWVNFLFLTITPVLSAILISYILYTQGFVAKHWVSAIIMYFATGLSITAGYHRLFAHRSYKAHPIIKFIFLSFGAATFQNSALKWCSDHRVHHNKVDSDHDPYSINKGFFYAHIGWIFLKEKRLLEKHFAKDLLKDSLVSFQHRYYLLFAIFFGLVLPTLIGHFLGSALSGFAIAGVGRIVFVHHATFFINSLCHVVGKQTYTTENTARDSYLMALFTYGEGFHNFHHKFQIDYRNGIKWYHYDPTKWLIKSLSFVGLAHDLKTVSRNIIEKAKQQMLALQQVNQQRSV